MKLSDIKIETEIGDVNKISSVPCENYREILKFLFRTPLMVATLFRDNRKPLKRLLGKTVTRYDNGEFLFDCWILTFPKGTKIIIFSAKDKGTCYEVIDDTDLSELKDFFDLLLDNLK
jgi:hypothetical protein